MWTISTRRGFTTKLTGVVAAEGCKTRATVEESLFSGDSIEEQILEAEGGIAQETGGMKINAPSRSQEVSAARGEVEGVCLTGEGACTLDDATKVEEFSETSPDSSRKADSGIQNDVSHDNPVLDTEDREKAVVWGSGDLHEVYAETVSAGLTKGTQLGDLDRLDGEA